MIPLLVDGARVKLKSVKIGAGTGQGRGAGTGTGREAGAGDRDRARGGDGGRRLAAPCTLVRVLALQPEPVSTQSVM